MDQERRHNWLEAYRNIGLLFFNLIVLITLINLLLFMVFLVRDALKGDPVSARYGKEAIQKNYPELSTAEFERLLAETWTRYLVYEPFTQFKESSYQGHYVNVHDQGFRLSKNQGPWPPSTSNFNVFIFGGSTTFGYGVADNQTIGSVLQQYLEEKLQRPVRIYNFGRGYYYSTQELILYERLLASGYVPDEVIFFDGLNDFFHFDDKPLLAEELKKFVDDLNSERLPLDVLAAKLPMFRFARWIWSFLHPRTIDADTEGVLIKNASELFPKSYNNHRLLGPVIDRYLRNKKLIEAISNAFSVKSVFVWQPVPTYDFEMRNYNFSGRSFGRHVYSKYGYQMMSERMAKEDLGSNFLWCADIQEGRTEVLYVDHLHYSPFMIRLFMRRVVDMMAQRDLLPAPVSPAHQA